MVRPYGLRVRVDVHQLGRILLTGELIFQNNPRAQLK